MRQVVSKYTSSKMSESVSPAALNLLSRIANNFQLPNTANSTDYFANLPTNTLRTLSYSLSASDVDQLCGVSVKLAQLCDDNYWQARLSNAYPAYVGTNSPREMVLYLDRLKEVQNNLGLISIQPMPLAKEILSRPYVPAYLTYPIVSGMWLLNYDTNLLRDITIIPFPASNVVVIGFTKRQSFIGPIPSLVSWGAPLSKDLIIGGDQAQYNQARASFTPDKDYRMLSSHVLFQFLTDAQAKGYMLLLYSDTKSESATKALRSLVSSANTIYPWDA